MDFLQALPEECIAHIISCTTPVDACRFSLVSKAFHSVAESDAVWERFIPSDFTSLIPSSSLPSSKKTLYLTLCNHSIIVDQGDQGKKSFQIDKRTGKKCCMVSATALSCAGRTNLRASWLEEVLRPDAEYWFDISGRINTLPLSPNTHYAVFLVFMMIHADGFYQNPVVLSVGLSGGNSSTKNVCLLDPNVEEHELNERFQGLQRPTVRSDEWLEIEMGGFFNSGREDEVEMKVIMQSERNWWNYGFYLEGIEVRPKHI